MGMEALKEPECDADCNQDSHQDKDVRINWKKFVLVGLIPIIIIFAVFFAVVKFIGRDNYDDVVMLIDQNFGLLGIFLYVYIVDTLIMPLSPDSFFCVSRSFLFLLVHLYIRHACSFFLMKNDR